MQDSLQKLDKPALKSKKFWAFLLGLIVLAALVAGGMAAQADVWVLRICACGVVLDLLGYTLGVAGLERVVLRAGAVIKPEIDDALDAPRPAPPVSSAGAP